MFNEHLKRIRTASKRTQGELADYLNISAQSVSKWEKGQSLPSIDMLPDIADFFRCPINVFFSKYELEIYESLYANAPSSEDLTDLLVTVINRLQDELDGKAPEKIDEHENLLIPMEVLFMPRVYEIVSKEESISCALLQKELKIGYAVSANIVDGLTSLGILKRNPETKKYEVMKDKIHLLEKYT